MDVIELDAASNNRVDDMRELVPRVYTTAADLRRKVFIIDEVQRIKEGWDVLLKTLEEPPDGVLFIFCTTDPSQIRPAVVSRLQRFTFRPLSTDEIEGKLGTHPRRRGTGRGADALELIARLAAGGMRDAESLLDQVLATSDAVIDADRRPRPPGARSGGRHRALRRCARARRCARRHRGARPARGRGAGPGRLLGAGRCPPPRTPRGGDDRRGEARPHRRARRGRAAADGYRCQPQRSGRLSLAARAGAPGGRCHRCPGRARTAARHPTPAPPDPRRGAAPGPRQRRPPRPRAAAAPGSARPPAPAAGAGARARPARARPRSATVGWRPPSGHPGPAGRRSSPGSVATRPTSRWSRTVGRSRSATVSSSWASRRTSHSCARRRSSDDRALEDGLAHVLGRPVGVRCVVANVELPVAGTGRTSTWSPRPARSSAASWRTWATSADASSTRRD